MVHPDTGFGWVLQGNVIVKRLSTVALIVLCAFAPYIIAAVLPEDRADALYHLYDGGGIRVDGPSYLLQKRLGDWLSLSGHYYVDSISSASIDVVTSASPYHEERQEESLSATIQHQNTSFQLSGTRSEESDYDASTLDLSLSQEMFGNLTTVSLGYAAGNNTVGMSTNPTFQADADTQSFRLGLKQVMSRNLYMQGAIETITDEGFLNNPYRSVRYRDPSAPIGYSYEPERYPRTRTSTAISLGGQYYLSYRAAVGMDYRFYQDSWDITAHTLNLNYTYPLKTHPGWILSLEYRYYTQTQANFYSDLFPHANAQNFLARDKELSPFTHHSIGFQAEYGYDIKNIQWLDRGQIATSLYYNQYNYDDFRDLRNTGTPGSEPLYSFDAWVSQFYLSVWF